MASNTMFDSSRWPELESIQTGGDDAVLKHRIGEIFLELRQHVYRYLLSVLHNEGDAEDLTQEAFIRLYHEASRGRSIRNVRSWIFTAAHNMAVDLTRRPEYNASLRYLPLDQEPEHRDSAPGPEQTLARRQYIAAALALLSPQERQCMELRGEGLCYREIAEVMGLRIPTVQTNLSRAMKKLLDAKP